MEKKDIIKLVAALLLGALCVGAVGYTVYKSLSRQRASDYQKEAREQVVLLGDTVSPTPTMKPSPTPKEKPEEQTPEVSPTPELTPTPEPTKSADVPKTVSSGYDLTQIMKVNRDIIGWIRVPGTEIDYPLLQSGANNKYIDTAYDGKTKTDFGSIFTNNVIETNVDGEQNLIIYGHNMRAAGYGMFTSLMQYKSADYRKAHPKLELYFPDGVRTYRLFAVYNITTKDSFRFDKMAFGGKADFEQYLAEVQKRSIYESGITANAGSRLVTLTTCDRDYNQSDGRFIVVFIAN